PSQVTMVCCGREAAVAKPRGDLLSDHDAAVLAARTADGHRDVALALALEARHGAVDEPYERIDERLGTPLAHDVRLHVPVPAREIAQLGHPIRVGKEPRVDHEVGVRRYAVLEPERQHRYPQAATVLAAEELLDPGP